jgi:excinuclease UvrABC nuclease subunit
MFGVHDEVLYVGKAKNLKKRVSQYFHRQLDNKTIQLVKQISRIQIQLTPTEQAALLLEIDLIKARKPKYNIVFRDDKFYPHLFLSTEHAFPRLILHRGDWRQKQDRGLYFGPYPNVQMARRALQHLQGIFLLRSCEDADFKRRKRPCLQYQMKRCAAPCVGYITETAYHHAVKCIEAFLQGQSDELLHTLQAAMEKASEALAFEAAGQYRDQMTQLRQLQAASHQIYPDWAHHTLSTEHGMDYDRIECFDASHFQGEATLVSCVVFNQTGPIKSAYRRFNIQGQVPGDDYAALKEALTRRYTRVMRAGGPWPDLVIIDGGLGQLRCAKQVFHALQVPETVQLMSVAKGQARKPGEEVLYYADNEAPVRWAPDSPKLHFIQQIRDEAHRFAIMNHRSALRKKRI